MKEKTSRKDRRARYEALSSTEKIQFDGRRLLKVLEIVRKVLLSIAIILLILGTTLSVISVLHKAQLVQEKTKIINLDSDNVIHGLPFDESVTLEEDTPEGWDKVYLQLGIICQLYGAVFVLFMLVSIKLRAIFIQILDAESPFSVESKRHLKVIFALITICVFLENQLIGLLLGFVFLYLYRLFAYGCELQKESDETL